MGGPRFCRARSNEIRNCASTCAATAGCREIPANIDAEAGGVYAGKMMVAGGATEYGHFSPIVVRDTPRGATSLAISQ